MKPARARNGRCALIITLLCSGCFASHRLGDTEPDPVLCCEEACGPGLSDNFFCGLDLCLDVTAPFCHSPDAIGRIGCELTYQCDETNDCPLGEVCREGELSLLGMGPPFYACHIPAECDSEYSRACAYACREDSECPPAAPRCEISVGVLGACSRVGFCAVR